MTRQDEADTVVLVYKKIAQTIKLFLLLGLARLCSGDGGIVRFFLGGLERCRNDCQEEEGTENAQDRERVAQVLLLVNVQDRECTP